MRAELARPDPRIVWARDARASSTYGDGYDAEAATGLPVVYPNGGDRTGTWLADTSDAAPWLEVTLPEVERAVALVVLETCGAGATRSIRDLDRDALLWEREPEKIAASREAFVLHVPLDPTAPPPGRLRLEVAPYAFGSDWHQIDGVGLLRVPLEEIAASPPPAPAVAHRRYAPDELAGIDLRRDDWRLVWARAARASSEWSSSYAAKTATGKPTIFPRGGDLEGAWLAASGDARAWIELTFPAPGGADRCFGFVALETCGAGAITRATDAEGQTLWEAAPESDVPSREARLLHVPLAIPRPETLRLWVSPAIRDYREIDAVALLAAPWGELREPPPPPPPPPPQPIPGAPEGGFVYVEGVLVGASASAPFVHASLRTTKGTHAANAGGPLRLRERSGRELPLETGRTIVYGGRKTRFRGTWAEVSRRAPRVASLFAERAPEPGDPVVLEAHVVAREEPVYVAGVARREGARGFRDASHEGVATLEAVALSTRPLEETSFPTHGVDDFAPRDGPRVRRGRPHPLRRAAIATGATALALGALASALLLLGDGSAARVVALLALAGATCTAAFALDVWGRMHHVPRFVGGGSAHLTVRSVPYTAIGFATAVLNGLVGFSVGVGLLAFGSTQAEMGALTEEVVLRGGLAVGGVYALLRSIFWLRGNLSSLALGLLAALRVGGRLAPGASGRYSGTLPEDHTYRRHESYFVKSEHLGTESYTDSRGRVQTRDRMNVWFETRIEQSGPRTAALTLPDGTRVVASRVAPTTDVALAHVAAGETNRYAALESDHAEGDPITLVGRITALEGGSATLEPSYVVLGSVAELRRRVLVQLLALIGLVALSLAGVLALLG